MSRIAVVFGSLVANTAAYAASVVQKGAAQKKQVGYMPFPWDHDDEDGEC